MDTELDKDVDQDKQQQATPEGAEEQVTNADETKQTESAGDDSIEEKEGEGDPQKPHDKTAKARIGQLYGKWKQEQREKEYWRQQALKSQTPPSTAPKTEPKQNDFDDYDDYVRALADHKAEQKVTQILEEREKKKSRETEETTHFQKVQTLQTKIQSGSEKYDDFEEVAYSPDVPINQTIIDALVDCDEPSEIVYHLGKNPQEALRISQLSPLAAAREIGKIEAKLANKPTGPQPKLKTKAPNPIKTVGGGGESSGKKLEDMSAAEYIAYMDEREFGGKK